MIPPEQAEAAAFLAGLSGGPPVETHISAVFRAADAVWKLKKAVRLPFLDFSSLADRRRFLQRELELNAPWVPGLYRDVAPLVRTPAGLGFGDGPAVEWVLRMARVPDADLMDAVAAQGGLTPDLLDGIADAVAGMHLALPPAEVADPAGRMRAVALGNQQAAVSAGLPERPVQAWLDAMLASLVSRAGLLEARAAAGLVRRAHGDLHLGNLLLWHGRPASFDALEFDEGMATIDLGYDLAFLLMDLDLRASRAAANRVLGRYVGRTGDAALVGALPPFLSMRALIRAHVAASRGGDGTAYLEAAQRYLHPVPPVVVAVGGLMGTGKTTLARVLAPGLGAAPGALHLRSDESRKRLHGLLPEDRLPPSAYDAEDGARTDATLLYGLRNALAGGHAVVLDATFRSPALRAQVSEAARAAGTPFVGLWLHAPMTELERRVAARQRDASDATPAVLRAAGAVAAPADWRPIDAADPATVLAAAQAVVAAVLAGQTC